MPEQIEVTLKFSSIARMVETLSRLNGNPPDQQVLPLGEAKVSAAAAENTLPVISATAAAAVTPAVSIAEPAATSGKRGRKAKAVEPAPAPAVSATSLFTDPVPPAPAAPGAPQEPAAPASPAKSGEQTSTTGSVSTSAAAITIDDCRAALGKVNEKHGMTVAYGMLQAVGAERVSLIPEAKRAEFVKSCEVKAAA